MATKYTTKEFVKVANFVHEGFYDYELVSYEATGVKVTIVCPNHGKFEQTPGGHLVGQGCPRCALDLKKKKMTLTTKDFIERAEKKHGNFYDYRLVEYVRHDSKVKILCPDHGEFMQTPDSHARLGYGCPECGRARKGSKKK